MKIANDFSSTHQIMPNFMSERKVSEFEIGSEEWCEFEIGQFF
jgi:hypothetical protein